MAGDSARKPSVDVASFSSVSPTTEGRTMALDPSDPAGAVDALWAEMDAHPPPARPVPSTSWPSRPAAEDARRPLVDVSSDDSPGATGLSISPVVPSPPLTGSRRAGAPVRGLTNASTRARTDSLPVTVRERQAQAASPLVTSLARQLDRASLGSLASLDEQVKLVARATPGFQAQQQALQGGEGRRASEQLHETSAMLARDQRAKEMGTTALHGRGPAARRRSRKHSGSERRGSRAPHALGDRRTVLLGGTTAKFGGSSRSIGVTGARERERRHDKAAARTRALPSQGRAAAPSAVGRKFRPAADVMRTSLSTPMLEAADKQTLERAMMHYSPPRRQSGQRQAAAARRGVADSSNEVFLSGAGQTAPTADVSPSDAFADERAALTESFLVGHETASKALKSGPTTFGGAQRSAEALWRAAAAEAAQADDALDGRGARGGVKMGPATSTALARSVAAGGAHRMRQSRVVAGAAIDSSLTMPHPELNPYSDEQLAALLAEWMSGLGEGSGTPSEFASASVFIEVKLTEIEALSGTTERPNRIRAAVAFALFGLLTQRLAPFAGVLTPIRRMLLRSVYLNDPLQRSALGWESVDGNAPADGGQVSRPRSAQEVLEELLPLRSYFELTARTQNRIERERREHEEAKAQLKRRWKARLDAEMGTGMKLSGVLARHFYAWRHTRAMARQRQQLVGRRVGGAGISGGGGIREVFLAWATATLRQRSQRTKQRGKNAADAAERSAMELKLERDKVTMLTEELEDVRQRCAELAKALTEARAYADSTTREMRQLVSAAGQTMRTASEAALQLMERTVEEVQDTPDAGRMEMVLTAADRGDQLGTAEPYVYGGDGTGEGNGPDGLDELGDVLHAHGDFNKGDAGKDDGKDAPPSGKKKDRKKDRRRGKGRAKAIPESQRRMSAPASIASVDTPAGAARQLEDADDASVGPPEAATPFAEAAAPYAEAATPFADAAASASSGRSAEGAVAAEGPMTLERLEALVPRYTGLTRKGAQVLHDMRIDQVLMRWVNYHLTTLRIHGRMDARVAVPPRDRLPRLHDAHLQDPAPEPDFSADRPGSLAASLAESANRTSAARAAAVSAARGDKFGKRMHNFSSDLQDGEILAALLSQVDPEHNPQKTIATPDPFHRCETVVKQLRRMSPTAYDFITAEHIASAESRLTSALVARLFVTHGGLHQPSDEHYALCALMEGVRHEWAALVADFTRGDDDSSGALAPADDVSSPSVAGELVEIARANGRLAEPSPPATHASTPDSAATSADDGTSAGAGAGASRAATTAAASAAGSGGATPVDVDPAKAQSLAKQATLRVHAMHHGVAVRPVEVASTKEVGKADGWAKWGADERLMPNAVDGDAGAAPVGRVRVPGVEAPVVMEGSAVVGGVVYAGRSGIMAKAGEFDEEGGAEGTLRATASASKFAQQNALQEMHKLSHSVTDLTPDVLRKKRTVGGVGLSAADLDTDTLFRTKAALTPQQVAAAIGRLDRFSRALRLAVTAVSAARDAAWRGRKMWQYLRSKAIAWVWAVFRARMLSLPKQVVDEREAAELAEYTVLPLPKYKDILDRFCKNQQHVNDTVNGIQALLRKHRVALSRIFQYYCASAEGSSISTMCASDYWHMLRDTKLAEGFGDKNSARIDLIFAKCNQRIGLPDEGPGFRNPDRELIPRQFVEALIRITVLLHETSGDPRGEARVAAGKLDLVEAFRVTLEDKVVPFGVQSNTEEFRAEVAGLEVRQVFKKYRPQLQRVFEWYAAQNKQNLDNVGAMDVNDFLKLLRHTQLLDAHLTPLVAKQIFAQTQLEEAFGDEEQEESAGGGEDAMVYSEFIEAVAAVALYKLCSPYICVPKRIDRFIREYLLPKARQKKVFTRSKASSSKEAEPAAADAVVDDAAAAAAAGTPPLHAAAGGAGGAADG